VVVIYALRFLTATNHHHSPFPLASNPC